MTKKTSSKRITREISNADLAKVGGGIVGRDRFDQWFDNRVKIERLFSQKLQCCKK
jgi:hypothetical protein